MKFGDMTCQIYCIFISINMTSAWTFLLITHSLVSPLPDVSSPNAQASHSLDGKPMSCLVPAGSRQTPWPDLHARWHHLLSSSTRNPVLSQRELLTALITVHFQMLLPLSGLFILILATHNRLSVSWGLNGVYLREKLFLSAHYLHCAWQMVISRFSVNAILMEGWWTNEWTDGWVFE